MPRCSTCSPARIRSGTATPARTPARPACSRPAITPFYINCGNDKIFQRLDVAGDRAPRPCDDPISMRPGLTGFARRDELFAILGEAFAQQPWSHWQTADARRAASRAARCAPSARRSARPKRGSAGSSRAFRIRHAGLGAERGPADPLFAHADRRPRRRARGRPAHGSRCCAMCWAMTTSAWPAR